MSSAKAALESDTRVSMPMFYFRIFVIVKVMCNFCGIGIGIMHYRFTALCLYRYLPLKLEEKEKSVSTRYQLVH